MRSKTPALSLLLALVAAAAGLLLGLHHPVWPAPAAAAFIAWTIACWRFPRAWLVVVPAVLPVMDFGPWTGWVVFQEFDLVLFGTLAGGHARRAFAGMGQPLGRDIVARIAPWALVMAAACVHGIVAAIPATAGLFDSETDPLNAWRVAKGPLCALLVLPLAHEAFACDSDGAFRRFAAGMLAGVTVVVVAALWERAAYPGLLDMGSDYRTVALFWEMHVGGAAIDGYLVLAAPFVAFAVVQARRPCVWAAAGLLAVLFEYVCLTTFSRGLAVAAPCAIAAFAWLRRRAAAPPVHGRWRTARWALMSLLILQAALVMSGAFMAERAKRASHDWGSRVEHWREGIALLQGPVDWMFGKGLGRIPAEYGRSVQQHGFSGAVRLRATASQAHAVIEGPARDEALGGYFALTQRVPRSAQPHRVSLDARVDAPTRLEVSVCERHLLYDGDCRRTVIPLKPGDGRWQRVDEPLPADGPWEDRWPPRASAFAVSVLKAKGRVEVDNVRLLVDGADVLRNGDFSRGMAHWWPSAQHYFVPWHIDSLPLEVLIEQGLAGVAAFAVLLAGAVRGGLAAWRRSRVMSPVVVSAVSGALLVGLVVSLLDVPRVAFLLFLLLFVLLSMDGRTPATSSPAAPRRE